MVALLEDFLKKSGINPPLTNPLSVLLSIFVGRFAEAQCTLGSLHHHGRAGFAVDTSRAAELYTFAARQGLVGAHIIHLRSCHPSCLIVFHPLTIRMNYCCAPTCEGGGTVFPGPHGPGARQVKRVGREQARGQATLARSGSEGIFACTV